MARTHFKLGTGCAYNLYVSDDLVQENLAISEHRLPRNGGPKCSSQINTHVSDAMCHKPKI